ncbi:OadG family protein [Streptococcus sp. S784/96/1]|uniref:OadG family protein n=1 Tax=Streptococcus sp. S784/96/1 TaxID=2653499 RepID=UPI001387568D|nr:OadG family protein [Streptococcus sp. S784/96/1]
MTYSLIDILQVTVVSMGLVFICLLGIMLMMQLTGKILGKQAPIAKQSTQAVQLPVAAVPAQTGLALVEEDELAKVAVLTALAFASKKESGKRFEVANVVKK